MAFCSAYSCNGFVHCLSEEQTSIKFGGEIRTIWWVYQNYSSKFSDGCGGVHIVVYPGIVLEEQHFRYFSCLKSLKKAGIGIC